MRKTGSSEQLGETLAALLSEAGALVVVIPGGSGHLQDLSATLGRLHGKDVHVDDKDAALAYSVPDFARKTGLARSTVWAGVADGTIPSIKHGRRRLIPKTAADRWLAKSEDGAA